MSERKEAYGGWVDCDGCGKRVEEDEARYIADLASHMCFSCLGEPSYLSSDSHYSPSDAEVDGDE